MYNKITIGQILGDAFDSISKNIKYFIVLALLLVGITYGSAFLLGKSSLTNEGFIFVYALLLAILYAKIAIIVHRAILLEEFSISRLFSWSSVDTKYIVIAVILFLIAFLLGMLIAFIFLKIKFLVYIGIFILGYLFARILLIFPAVAVGETLKIKQSWEITDGYGFKLFTLLILIPAITNILLKYMPANSYTWLFITAIISSFIIIFEISVLSHCYKELTRQNETNETVEVNKSEITTTDQSDQQSKNSLE